MSADVAFTELMDYQRQTEALAQVMGRLSWDQETVMPRGAAEQRAEEMAALEGVLHARRTDPRLAEWLELAEPEDEEDEAQLRLIRRSHERATKVPGRLAQEIARVTSAAQGIWAEARAADDVSMFLPTLTEVVRLKREEAAALAGAATATMRSSTITSPPPRRPRSRPSSTGCARASSRCARRCSGPRSSRSRCRGISGSRRRSAWRAIWRPPSATTGAAGGWTWQSIPSRPARAAMCASPPAWSRPTRSTASIRRSTRSATRPTSLGIDPDYALTPIGAGVSMGVHESQSRIYENQLGRSRAFTGWLYGRMSERFGDFGIADAEAFYATANRVQSGYIRTEADEVHYNLHIMMRFDLERGLIRGTLEPEDLEEAWNTRFLEDFGVAVDRPSHGMLQDVHWSVGLFGYFPTYALGNVYAGCLMKAIRAAVPDLDDQLARGDTSGATGWLRENLQRHGGLYRPHETVTRACGFEPTEEPLLDYLEEKFRGIYRL